MISVVLTGTGNVAHHLFRAIEESKKAEIIQVFNHSKSSLASFSKKVPTTTSFGKVKDADLYLIAVSDKVIQKTAFLFREKNGVVAHTSGSQDLPDLGNGGIFYPLQTFSKGKKLDFKNIPICVEGRSQKAEILLLKFGKIISNHVQTFTSEKRKKLHLAAVFACNFSNHMMALSERFCQKNEIDFSFLSQLILETAQKAIHSSPKEMQTGPAIREDEVTLETHRKVLQNDPKLLKFYNLISQSIQDEK